MGHCEIGSKDGVNFIQCYRGDSRPRHKVKNKVGDSLLVECSKQEFDTYGFSRPVRCYRTINGIESSVLYMKGFLEWQG